MGRKRQVKPDDDCIVPALHNAKTVNSKGKHPELLAVPEDGLGPPLIWDRVSRVWKNFHNERTNGKLGFKFCVDFEESAN